MLSRGKQRSALYLKRLTGFVRANRIFSISLAVFVLVSVQFALHTSTNITPDEPYHYAAIKTYSAQYSPFITHQASLVETNDMVRYPCYLYHYLLSFPYRMAHGLGASDNATLVILRLMNVLLGIFTILLLRKLLTVITSRRAANFSAGLFALLPITMAIYGGLNYDNLMLTIIFASCLQLVTLRKQFSWTRLISFLVLLELGALTQYKFLPIGAALFAYMVVILIKYRSHKQVKFQITHLVSVLLVTFVVFSGLVVERYGINLVSFKNLTPTCQSVHRLSECLQFPLNERDYIAAHDNIIASLNPATYAETYWYKNMVRGVIYPSPMLWLRYVFFVALLVAIASALYHREHHYNERWIGFVFITVALFYIAIVFADNYDYYLRTGLPNTINGRYLLPALPLLFVPLYANIMRSYQKFIALVQSNRLDRYEE